MRERVDRRNFRERQDALASEMTLGRLSHQGLARTYYIHTPRTSTPGRPMPLVLAFHGGRGRAEKLALNTGLNKVADREGFIVVYPNGVEHHWRDGRNIPGRDNTIDDVSFVRALIGELEKTRNIDSRRIYATGMSNGGFFTMRLACELSDKIAAFAPVAATLSVNLQPRCRPNKPVSILMIGGTNDQYVPWQGGQMKNGSEILSMPQTVEFWKNHNACAFKQGEDVNQHSLRESNDFTELESTMYSGCRSNAEVRVLTVVGGRHVWPGGDVQDRNGERSPVNASQEVWNFFKRHTLS